MLAANSLAWLTRSNLCQVHHAPFGFAHDLLSENQDIVILQCEAGGGQRIENNIRQVIALADQWECFARE